MATTSNMFMYSLTIQNPTTVTHAIPGQFSGTKEQQIITAAGSRLTLLRPDLNVGRLTTVLSHDVFGIIRSLAIFRLAGSSKGATQWAWERRLPSSCLEISFFALQNADRRR